MVVSNRNLAAGDGDELRLLGSRERLAIMDLASMAQRRIHSTLGEASPNRHDHLAADVKRAADLRQGSAFPQFQQDLRAGARPGGVD